MFTISSEKMRELARYPEIVGGLMLGMLVPGTNCLSRVEEINYRPPADWTPCDPGPAAAGHYAGHGLRGFRSACGIVTVTLVDYDDGEEVHIVAEGDGWSLVSEGAYGGWSDLRHFPPRHRLDEAA